MKTIFLCGILFLASSTISAQDKIKEIEKPVNLESLTVSNIPKYTITLGLNSIDNGGSNFLPFSNLSFKNPFIVATERHFNSNFSLAIALSTNELKIQSVTKPYFAIDVTGNFYFDDYIFNNKNIETFAGLGVGRYYLESKGKTTLNISGGARYWFDKHFGVTLQTFGKVGLQSNKDQVNNHYQYNVGIIYRTIQ